MKVNCSLEEYNHVALICLCHQQHLWAAATHHKDTKMFMNISAVQSQAVVSQCHSHMCPSHSHVSPCHSHMRPCHTHMCNSQPRLVFLNRVGQQIPAAEHILLLLAHVLRLQYQGPVRTITRVTLLYSNHTIAMALLHIPAHQHPVPTINLSPNQLKHFV